MISVAAIEVSHECRHASSTPSTAAP
jgi:hypothetical protein